MLTIVKIRTEKTKVSKFEELFKEKGITNYKILSDKLDLNLTTIHVTVPAKKEIEVYKITKKVQMIFKTTNKNE